MDESHEFDANPQKQLLTRAISRRKWVRGNFHPVFARRRMDRSTRLGIWENVRKHQPIYP